MEYVWRIIPILYQVFHHTTSLQSSYALRWTTRCIVSSSTMAHVASQGKRKRKGDRREEGWGKIIEDERRWKADYIWFISKNDWCSSYRQYRLYFGCANFKVRPCTLYFCNEVQFYGKKPANLSYGTDKLRNKREKTYGDLRNESGVNVSYINHVSTCAISAITYRES